MFDTSNLRGRIVAKFGTIGAFAEAAGCARSTISLYLNGNKDLKQATIEKWAKLLEIEDCDIPLYFFTPKVHE